LSSELNNLQLNSKSQREIIHIQQNNNISKLEKELENVKFRASKLEAEIDHYKAIYRDLTKRYNKEKSERHAMDHQQREMKNAANEVNL
jgi:predicted RNase H-like nuclease (RuvC/YqgF family)